jgi:hypothetical protein
VCVCVCVMCVSRTKDCKEVVCWVPWDTWKLRWRVQDEMRSKWQKWYVLVECDVPTTNWRYNIQNRSTQCWVSLYLDTNSQFGKWKTKQWHYRMAMITVFPLPRRGSRTNT